MIVAMDGRHWPRRVQKIAELGLERDTLFLFISDNGGPLQDNASNNTPLRGRKSQLWEGGIRVPYVVSLPGKIPAGKRYDRPVSTLDFLPTALALAGVDSRGQPGLEGVNLLPYLRGESAGDPHENLFWRHRHGGWAIRSGDMKLVRDVDGQEYLYDLARDLSEKTDLAKEKTRPRRPPAPHLGNVEHRQRHRHPVARPGRLALALERRAREEVTPNSIRGSV